MEIWIILAFVGFLLIFVVVIAILSKKFDQQRGENWSGLVESMPGHQSNLFGSPNQPSSRIYRDRETKLGVFRKYDPIAFRKGQSLYKRIQLSLDNQLPVHLEFHEKGVFEKRSPQQVGDKAIDDRFYINGWPQEFVKEALTSPAFRNRLLQLNPHFVKIIGNELYYEERYDWGSTKNVEQLENLLEFLCDLADLVEEQGVTENKRSSPVKEEKPL